LLTDESHRELHSVGDNPNDLLFYPLEDFFKWQQFCAVATLFYLKTLCSAFCQRNKLAFLDDDEQNANTV
jgi:hypothetical protein